MTWTGSLVNDLLSTARNTPGPVAGEAVTFLGWTDRDPGRIVEVLSPARILVERVIPGPLEWGRCHRVEVAGLPGAGYTMEYTLRKNGAWVARGESMREGARLLVGHAEHYRDPGF